MKLTSLIRQALNYKNHRIVLVKWSLDPGLEGNVYLVDINDEIIWQIEPPEDLSLLGYIGDAYTYIWFDGETLIARSMRGDEYSIDLRTGKRIELLRENK
jgi:hypothetical protein